MTIIIDHDKISEVELQDVDHSDYPDFCDANILYAEYDGEPMTELQLDIINQDSDFIYQSVIKQYYN